MTFHRSILCTRVLICLAIRLLIALLSPFFVTFTLSRGTQPGFRRLPFHL